jgi:hypothetical protein
MGISRTPQASRRSTLVPDRDLLSIPLSFLSLFPSMSFEGFYTHPAPMLQPRLKTSQRAEERSAQLHFWVYRAPRSQILMITPQSSDNCTQHSSEERSTRSSRKARRSY